MSGNYAPLTVETLGPRLSQIPEIAQRLGSDYSIWTVREVGDGNLNLVFICEGPDGKVIVKQALPYVRLVGDSWPLPLKRAFFEYHALQRQAARDPGTVPEIYYFDEAQALIVMEFLSPHIILRFSLKDGKRHEGLAETAGLFCARTLFRGSDLSMKTAERKADLALFADNAELCDITENLVFTDPYFDAKMNRHTSPQLDTVVAELRADQTLKAEVQHLKMTFCANAETLLHGDLHAGSIMVTDEETRVIDPEFAVYGPIGFDIGMLLGNFLMAYFAQPGHPEIPGGRTAFADWILSVTMKTWAVFEDEFRHLWRTERNGILYDRRLFEDQGHELAAEQALNQRLAAIWEDALGFAGIEMHRRILGLAHILELDSIENEDIRASCEEKALRMGRLLVLNRGSLRTIVAVAELARHIQQGSAK